MSAIEGLDFGLLGPVQVTAVEASVRLTGPRQERLLAMLLLNFNRSVAMDRLIDVVWERHPPSTAKRQIQDLASSLRRTLVTAGASPDTITLAGAGYLLRLDGHRVDARSFEDLTDAARASASAEPSIAAKTLRSALGLWRGPALAGMTAPALVAGAQAWNERRLATWEDCLRLELSLGRHREIVSELSQLVSEHPFREELTGLLIRALTAGGRRFEALAAYQGLRDRLRAELGMEPSQQLRRIHQEVLRDDR